MLIESVSIIISPNKFLLTASSRASCIRVAMSDEAVIGTNTPKCTMTLPLLQIKDNLNTLNQGMDMHP